MEEPASVRGFEAFAPGDAEPAAPSARSQATIVMTAMMPDS